MAIADYDRVYFLVLELLAFLIPGIEATRCRVDSWLHSMDDNSIYCPSGCCGTSYDQYCCNFSIGTVIGCSVGGLIAVVVFVTLICCCIRHRQGTRNVIRTTLPNGVPIIYQTSNNGYTSNGSSVLMYSQPAFAGSSPLPPAVLGSPPPPGFTGSPPPPGFLGSPLSPSAGFPGTAYIPPGFEGSPQPPAFACSPPPYSEVASETNDHKPPSYDNTAFKQ